MAGFEDLTDLTDLTDLSSDNDECNFVFTTNTEPENTLSDVFLPEISNDFEVFTLTERIKMYLHNSVLFDLITSVKFNGSKNKTEYEKKLLRVAITHVLCDKLNIINLTNSEKYNGYNYCWFLKSEHWSKKLYEALNINNQLNYSIIKIDDNWNEWRKSYVNNVNFCNNRNKKNYEASLKIYKKNFIVSITHKLRYVYSTYKNEETATLNAANKVALEIGL